MFNNNTVKEAIEIIVGFLALATAGGRAAIIFMSSKFVKKEDHEKLTSSLDLQIQTVKLENSKMNLAIVEANNQIGLQRMQHEAMLSHLEKMDKRLDHLDRNVIQFMNNQGKHEEARMRLEDTIEKLTIKVDKLADKTEELNKTITVINTIFEIEHGNKKS